MKGPETDRWLLVETLDAVPSVIAEGSSLRRCRPLKNMFRGAALTALSDVVADVQRTHDSVELHPKDAVYDIHTVIGLPVMGPSGAVFGVQIAFLSGRNSTPPPAPVVAGWEFEICTPARPLRTTWTSQFRTLYGIADEGVHSADGTMGLADLYRRVPKPSDIARLMTGVVDAEDGHFLDGTLIIRRDDGELRLVHYVRRAVSNSQSTWLRGIDHDITSTTTTGELAISILDSEIASTLARTTGTFCAMLDTHTGTVITWISEPVNGLDDDTVGGRTPLIDEEQRASLREHRPVVACLNKQLLLLRSFPCIGHGATAAALLLLTPLNK